MRANLKTISRAPMGVRVKETRNVSRMEDMIVKISTVEDECCERLNKLIDAKTEAVRRIARVSNPDEWFILLDRVLGGSWDNIAEALERSTAQTYRIYDRALDSFAAANPDIWQGDE